MSVFDRRPWSAGEKNVCECAFVVLTIALPLSYDIIHTYDVNVNIIL
jgi:hypothetical protein